MEKVISVFFAVNHNICESSWLHSFQTNYNTFCISEDSHEVFYCMWAGY